MGITRLPQSYQELSYIEATGDQYLVTDYCPNQNTKVVAKFLNNKTQGENYQSIFGSQDSAEANRFYTGIGSAMDFQWRTSATGGTVQFGTVKAGDILEITMEYNKYTLVQNGVETVSTTALTGDFQCTYPMAIFGRNSDVAPTSPMLYKGQLFFMDIYEIDELVHSYVPCYRKYDDKVGLYDTVTNTFIEPIGDGLLKGKDVEGVGVYITANNDTKEIVDMYNTTKTTNMFDGLWTRDYINVNDGSISSNSQFAYSTNAIPVEAGKTYIATINGVGSDYEFTCCFYTDETTDSFTIDPSGVSLSTNGTKIINVPEGVSYVRLRAKYIPSSTFPYNTLVQVEEGEIATPYQPYSETGKLVKAIKRAYKITSRLPEGYTEVEYIENVQYSGLRYCDTGLYGTENTKIVTKFINSEVGLANTRCIVADNWNSSSFLRISECEKTNAPWNFGSATYTFSNFFRADTEFNISVDKNGILINDVEYAWNGTVGTFTTAVTLKIMGPSNSTDRTFVGKMYPVEIYESNVLVGHFIPARRKADNALGFFDLVTNTFKAFTYTTPSTIYVVTTGKKVNTPKMIYQNMSLPTDYISLEYLVSEDGAYIDYGTVDSKYCVPCISARGTYGVYDTSSKSKNLFSVYDLKRVPVTMTNGEARTYTAVFFPAGTYSCSANEGVAGAYLYAQLIGDNNQVEGNPNYLVVGDKFSAFDNIVVPEGKRLMVYNALTGQGITASQETFTTAKVQIEAGTYTTEYMPSPFIGNANTEGTFTGKVKLPNGYDVLEYIEQTGAVTINTDVLSDENVYWNFDAQSNANVTTSQIVLNISTNTANWVGTHSNTWSVGGGQNTSFSCTDRVQAKVRFYADENNVSKVEMTIGDETVSRNGGEFLTGRKYNLLNHTYPFIGKVYNYNCVNTDETFKRYYVPAYHKATDTHSFYEVYTKTFLPITTGEGLTGKLLLPKGYTQLEYIQNDGVAYVNTGYINNLNTEIYCECGYYTIAGGVYGNMETNNAITAYIGSTAANHRFGNKTAVINTNDSIRYTILQNKEGITINDASVLYAEQDYFKATQTVTIFKSNGSSLTSAMKVYNMYIKDNNNLVHDFIPCTNPNGEYGFYDLVTKRFFGNANTTGTLTGA